MTPSSSASPVPRSLAKSHSLGGSGDPLLPGLGFDVQTEKHSRSSRVKNGPLVDIPYSLSEYLRVDMYSICLEFKGSFQNLTKVIYPSKRSD